MAFTKINAAGIGTTETVTVDGLTVINDGSFGGNLSVGGTITYEDVTNVDSVGIITARAGVLVGSGITLSKDGDIFATGVTTATKFVGDGSELTGVASTENIRTNTNATFLQNINVSGTSTVSGKFFLGHASSRTVGDRTHLIQIEGTALQDGGLSMVRNRNDEHSTSITLAKTRGSSTGANTIVQSGDSIGEFAFAAGDGTDVVTRAGRIHCEIDGTPGANDMPGRLIFSTTADGAASPTERVRIDSSGNFGLGTNNPTTKLHVQQSAVSSAPSRSSALYLENNANCEIQFVGNSSNDCQLRFGTSSNSFKGAIEYELDNNNLIHYTNGSERLRIDSNGDINLGNNPTNQYGYKLNIQDNAILYAQTASSSGTELKLYLDHSNTIANFGTVSTSHLAFVTANTERLRIDSTGRIGLGNDLSNTYDSTYNQVVIGNGADSNNGITFHVGTSSGTYLGFKDTTDGTVQGLLSYTHNNDTFAFRTAGTERVRITNTSGTAAHNSSVRIGTSSAIHHADDCLNVYGGGDSGVVLVAKSSGNGSAIMAYSNNNGSKNFTGQNQSGSTTFSVTGAGAVSKSSGSFRIDHPLVGMSTSHYLQHSFIEGPQADLIYRGVVTLSSGVSSINIDTVSGMTEGTFVKLCTDVSCFTSNESDWTPVKGSVSGNVLTITAQDNTSTATVSWLVIGERQDDHMKDGNTTWTNSDGKVIVEILKTDVD